jgi:hypothetical protein
MYQREIRGLPLNPKETHSSGTSKLSHICPFLPFVGHRLPAWLALFINYMTLELLDSILYRVPSLWLPGDTPLPPTPVPKPGPRANQGMSQCGTAVGGKG